MQQQQQHDDDDDDDDDARAFDIERIEISLRFFFSFFLSTRVYLFDVGRLLPFLFLLQLTSWQHRLFLQ